MKRRTFIVLAACAFALAAAGGASAALAPAPPGVEGGWDVGGQVSNAQGTTPTQLHRGLYLRDNYPGNGEDASDSTTINPITGCDSTGCGTWQAGGYGAAFESRGELSGNLENDLSIDGAQTGFGGTSYVRTHGTIHDTITLSQAATVHVVGTIQGSISSTNDTGGEYSDPSPDASVAVGFFKRNPLCLECGWMVEGYRNDFGNGRSNETFDIPVDLPAGDSDFVANLEEDSGTFLLDGPADHYALTAKVNYFVVQFHIVVPDGVTVESASGHLPVTGGGPPADVTAPVTSATAPTGWTQGPATVSLDATDGGSGVSGITYSATGANPIAETTATGGHVDIPVTADGETTITYHATDKAGNAEAPQTVTVHVDGTAPSVVASPFTGWSNHPVTVTIHAADDGSGVASVSYRAPGSPSDTTVAGDTATVTVQMQGTSTLTYWATDEAGNVSEPQKLTLRIDADPPRITAPGGITVDATIPSGAYVTYTATAWDVIDPSPTIDCTPASGSLFVIGVTKVTCTAQDEAGNTSTATFEVQVRGALEMTSELPQSSSSLGSLVANAQREIERGNTQAAIALLDAYIHVVQSGHRDLTQEQIDAAVALARQIITVLG